jgi:PncC family amidohydrolase
VAISNVQAIVEELANQLRLRGETVSFAESCTGGLASSMMTSVAGVSDVYLGSIVAYSYPVKISELGVEPGVLSTMGAVSLPVARQMAVGARSRLGSSWTVSITGIAGPGGGTDEKPVGTVCFGVCGPGVESVYQRWFEGDRRQVQEASAFFALSLLISELGDSHE